MASEKASNSNPKVAEAEKLVKKADKLTKLSFTKWFPDWTAATPLYEQAANAFKLAKMPEAAKIAYEKAATGQERSSSPWSAGKHLESAGGLARELGNFDEVIDLYKRASELYVQCGKVQPAADALDKGARAVEDVKPDAAVRMYIDACALLEEDGRDQMAFDSYRSAASIYIKLNRYEDAATVFLRWGQAADKCKAVQSQCKAYLSAIIVYLFADNFNLADASYNDCSQMDSFFKSDQNHCAVQLLSAYREGRPDEIKHVVSTSSVIPHLDHMVIRLAKQLPSGKVTAIVDETGHNELDEDDLR